MARMWPDRSSRSAVKRRVWIVACMYWRESWGVLNVCGSKNLIMVHMCDAKLEKQNCFSEASTWEQWAKSTSSCSPSLCHSLPLLQEFVLESTSLESGDFSFVFFLFPKPFVLCSHGINSFPLHCTEAGTGFCFADLVERTKSAFALKVKHTNWSLFLFFSFLNYYSKLLVTLILQDGFLQLLKSKFLVSCQAEAQRAPCCSIKIKENCSFDATDGTSVEQRWHTNHFFHELLQIFSLSLSFFLHVCEIEAF